MKCDIQMRNIDLLSRANYHKKHHIITTLKMRGRHGDKTQLSRTDETENIELSSHILCENEGKAH